MKDIKNTILQKFREVYGEGEAHAFFAPGRVNLIGEHTDYNGGHVFPCALTIVLMLWLARETTESYAFSR